NEGRHTHRAWLAEDEIPEVARAARPGHRVPGMARVHEHVTVEMKRRVLNVLENRRQESVAALTIRERERLFAAAPVLEAHYRENTKNGLPKEPASKMISQISPKAG